MAEHNVLKVIDVNPAWEFPTYRFWVHLDTDKLHESGLPDMQFVQPFEISTAPPGVRSDSLTGDQLIEALTESVAARKSDLVREGVLAGKAEITLDAVVKVASKVNPIRVELEKQEAAARAAEDVAAGVVVTPV